MSSHNWPPSGGGSGDMVGPAGATDNALARFDTASGKLLQNSVVIVDDSGNMTGVGSFSATSANISGLTASRALQTDGSNNLESSAVTTTELGYLSGVSSSVQTQLNARLQLTGGTMTGVLTLNADPVNPLEASTKQYVDSVAQGLDPKANCEVFASGNITLSGEQTIDGVLTSSSRVLVAGQTLSENNGIYVSAAGAWTRAADMDSWAEVPGAYAFISQGTTYGDTGWVCTSDEGGTLGSTPITWVQFAGAGTYTADGNALKLVGTQFSVDLDGSTLSQSASGLRVAALTVSRALVSDGSGNLAASAVTATEQGYLSGVTSAIQTQLNAKEPTITGAATTITGANLTASRALNSTAGGKVAVSAVTATEQGYLSGVTSAIQTQINDINTNLRAVAGNVSVAGNVTLTDRRMHFVSTAAARTLTLPAASATLYLELKDVTGTANTNPITVTPPAGTIDGASSFVLDSDFGAARIFSDGTNYFVA